MTYGESKVFYDKYKAYSAWITVEEGKQLGEIPKEYWDIFKDKCECGSDNVIAPNLRREMCCDPRCPIKEVYKLAEMFRRFNVVGLGYANCNAVYRAMHAEDKRRKEKGEKGLFLYRTYTEVLAVAWENYPASIRDTVVARDFFEACMRIRGTSMTFTQLVASLGLAGIGSNAGKLFDGVDSFTELKDAILKEGGVISYCIGRGVKSPEVIYSVASAMEDIAVADFACRGAIRKSGLFGLKVCITGSVVCDGIRMTKARFVSMCNELCIDRNGVPLMEISNVSGPATVPFVLYSSGSGSAKYNTGLSRGKITDEFGIHSVLMTATDFYNWLKGAMEEWNSLDSTATKSWQAVLSDSLKKMTSPKAGRAESF